MSKVVFLFTQRPAQRHIRYSFSSLGLLYDGAEQADKSQSWSLNSSFTGILDKMSVRATSLVIVELHNRRIVCLMSGRFHFHQTLHKRRNFVSVELGPGKQFVFSALTHPDYSILYHRFMNYPLLLLQALLLSYISTPTSFSGS